MAKNKPGRPEAKPDEKMQQFQVRLSPKEKEMFERRARQRGLKIAQWLRSLGHDDCATVGLKIEEA